MSAPEVIYLQWGDEEESPYWDETTWCAEKIGELDVKYILADPVNMAAPELLEALKLILPLAKGYRPETQTMAAATTCASWIHIAEEIIAKAQGGES